MLQMMRKNGQVLVLENGQVCDFLSILRPATILGKRGTRSSANARGNAGHIRRDTTRIRRDTPQGVSQSGERWKPAPEGQGAGRDDVDVTAEYSKNGACSTHLGGLVPRGLG
jgi:hypothetical protein